MTIIACVTQEARNSLVTGCLQELRDDYERAVKTAIMDYVIAGGPMHACMHKHASCVCKLRGPKSLHSSLPCAHIPPSPL